MKSRTDTPYLYLVGVVLHANITDFADRVMLAFPFLQVFEYSFMVFLVYALGTAQK